MSDHFTRHKLAWLEQIVSDPQLSHFSVRIGTLLAVRYLNRQTGDAYPSQLRLAADTGATPDGVRKAVRRLADGGHLGVKPGAGSRLNSRYTLLLLAAKPQTSIWGSQQEPQTSVCKTPDASLKNPSPIHPPIPLKEPIEEPQDQSFELWWSAYPNRVAKKAARRVFDGILKRDEATVAELIDGAKRYAQSAKVLRGFPKNPTTWLSGGCWTDDPDTRLPIAIGGRQSQLERALEQLTSGSPK